MPKMLKTVESATAESNEFLRANRPCRMVS